MRRGRAVAKAILKLHKKAGDKDPKHFADLVVSHIQKRKLTYLKESILNHLACEEKKRNKRGVLKIITSHKPDQSSVELMSRIMGADASGVDISVDKNIIGGCILRHGDNEIDASMKTYVSMLRSKLLKG